MNESNISINTLKDPAPQNAESENVARETANHQSAAMLAARMIRFQYSTEAKDKFRRECVSRLKASLAGARA